MGNYGELWGITSQLWLNRGELWGIMGNHGSIMVARCGIMGNYREFWGFMGSVRVVADDKCLGLLAYAKSVKVFDPREREHLFKEIVNYVTVDMVQRVVLAKMAATLGAEWDLYWGIPAVPAQLDLMAWWRGMKSQLPQLATLAIRT